VLGGILYGALCAWKQEDVKRLIAYSSVAHLGYVMLGLFALTQASLEGSVLQMVNHGVSTGCALPPFRRHLRPAPHPPHRRVRRPREADAGLRGALHRGDPCEHRAAGHQRVHRRVHGDHRHVRVHKLGHFAGIQAAGAALGVILGAVYMLMVVQKMFFGPITKGEPSPPT
jgi:NADH-quinone oxidoreductase subunit M